LSRIPELGEKFKNMPTVLAEYETAIEDYEDNLAIKGKTLEVANRENPGWQAYYDERRIELKTLVDYMEAQVQRTRGRLFKTYTEAHSRELTDRAKDKYIDNEDAYLTTYEIYLEVKELYNKYQAVVDAFTSRGYALNNITKIRVAALDDAIL
jgi:hypothetical protein